MSWLEQLFGVPKVAIGMVHFPALPGTPLYDEQGGLPRIRDRVRRDLTGLQDGGIDSVMFCNENDRPYTLNAGFETVAVMTAVIQELRPEIRVPFGIDVLWDPKAAIAIAKAVGGRFVREVFTGAYASDFGVWDTAPGEVLRYRRSIDATDVRLLYNINAEFAAPIADRPIGVVAKGVVFASLADAICVSGAMTGEQTNPIALQAAREALPETPIFANTGSTEHNVADLLAIADGVVVGTSLKVDGVTWNAIDPERVKRFMAAVRRVREPAVVG